VKGYSSCFVFRRSKIRFSARRPVVKPHGLRYFTLRHLENNFKGSSFVTYTGLHWSRAFIRYANNIKKKFKQVKLKVNFCLSAPWRHVEGVELQLHSFNLGCRWTWMIVCTSVSNTQTIESAARIRQLLRPVSNAGKCVRLANLLLAWSKRKLKFCYTGSVYCPNLIRWVK